MSPFISIYRKININQLFEKLKRNPREGTLAFCESLDTMMRDAGKKTLLKIRRNEIGISQRKLSEAAGIPIRTIQQYEQRQKNINKAQIKYVLSLAKVLVCRPEELLEIE